MFLGVMGCRAASADVESPSAAPPSTEATDEATESTEAREEPRGASMEAAETPGTEEASGSEESLNTEVVAAASSGAATGAASSSEPPEPLPLPEGTTVLHVGDSFAGALGLPLKRMLSERGVRGVLEQETASYIPNWSSGDKLQRLLQRHRPDLVLITLGANELEIVEPEQRIRNIRRIVATIGERPCVWIGTPLWAGPKNGLMDIIRDNVAPCRYMDTNDLIDHMPRVADGIHPTTSARENWAAVVIDWLQTHRRPTEVHPWNLGDEPQRASSKAEVPPTAVPLRAEGP